MVKGDVVGRNEIDFNLDNSDWCWGIMKIELKYKTKREILTGTEVFIADSIKVWKTCECAPLDPPKECDDNLVWTRIDSETLYGEVCKAEHKCDP